MLDTITHKLDSVTQRLDSVSNHFSELIQQAEITTTGVTPVRDYVVPLAHYVGFDKWDWLALIIAFASSIWAYCAYRSQKETEKNTMKITEESQFMLMIDYFRHFYANLIASKSIVAKLDNRFHTHYPSEEHIRKLGVDTDALHPEVFFHSKEKYNHIHELLMLVNNYNTELGVAEKHLCTQNLIANAKRRDLNTLIFKQNLFCEKFCKAMKELCKPDEPTGWKKRKRCICLYEEAGRLEDIENAQKRYNEYIEKSRKNIIETAVGRDDLTDEQKKLSLEEKIEILRARVKKRNKDYFSADEKKANKFAEIFFHDDKDRELFFDLINSNIYYEIHGKNTQGYDKIAILPF